MRNVFYLIITMMLLNACKHAGNQQTKTTQEASQTNSDSTVYLSDAEIRYAGIDLVHPQIKEMAEQLQINGQVDVPPQNLISISCPLGGFLKYTHLLPGDHVKKGEVIASMEDPQYIQLQQDYLTAKTNVQYLKQEMERQRALAESQATSMKNYQQAIRDYETENIRMQALAAKLRLININPDNLTESNIRSTIQLYAPIDGFVAQVNANVGKYFMPTDVLLELVDPRDIHAAMIVFQEDIPKFQIGTRGVVYDPTKPDQKYPVEVILITRNVDSNRTGILHCHFLKAPDRLIPGMYLTGIFTLSKQRVIAVPEDAVVHYQGNDYVFVQQDAHHFQLTPVHVGQSDSGWVSLLGVNTQVWNSYQVATHNAFAILGKMKNKIED